MVRDSVQLETVVNTISHEYLLDFTSEYGIPKTLHPELPGPGDRIVDFSEGKVDERVFPTVVDWRTNASKDGMPANGTYSVEDGRALDTHRTPIKKQPEMLLCMVGISRRYYLGDEVYPTFHYDDDRGGNGPIQFDSCSKSYEGEDWEPPPDHVDLRPSGSSRGGKSLAAMQLCLASNVFVSEGVPADVSDPDPLAFADAPSPHPADVAQSSQGIAAAGDPESENVSSPAEARELEIKNLEAKANAKRAAEDKSAGLSQELERMHAQVLDLQVSNERLSQQGMSEGLGYGVEHGQAQRNVESIEAYDPKAEAKFTAALQALKDLKMILGRMSRNAYATSALSPLSSPSRYTQSRAEQKKRSRIVCRTHGVGSAHHARSDRVPDAPIDVIMAALYLESDTGEDAPQCIRDLRPSSSQLTIPVYPEVRDPRNPWACKEEIVLADAIAANISRAEKKKKCRIVCRTYGVGSAHQARSDGVPVSAPTMVPQGLALLLVDATTQTE
nr:hypothetical protein [Tanacetum cinerariifolium]